MNLVARLRLDECSDFHERFRVDMFRRRRHDSRRLLSTLKMSLPISISLNKYMPWLRQLNGRQGHKEEMILNFDVEQKEPVKDRYINDVNRAFAKM